MTRKCLNGHNQRWLCHAGAPTACVNCERDRKEAEKKAQKDFEEKLKRDEKIQRHLKEVAKIDEQMEQITQSVKDARLDSEQKAILTQKRKDLAAAKERANETQKSHQPDSPGIHNNDDPPSVDPLPEKSSPASSGPAASTPNKHSKLREHIKTAVEHNKSPSKTEWQRQKDQENADIPAIDKIMEMIGLEDVKSQILRIKAKVDTSIRQGTDLRKERLGLVLLGNPGTGISSFKPLITVLIIQR